MQRKHVVFFSIVALVCVATLILFQMFGDWGYFGWGGLPPQEQANPPATAPAN
jgi:hypothetical protein